MATNSSLPQQPEGFLLTRTTVSFIFRVSEVWPAKAPALLALGWGNSDGVSTPGTETHVISRGLRNRNGVEG